MKILITGAAGFIGFSLSKHLLTKGYQVIGVDNLNEYYNVNLKIDRINILKKSQEFKFYKFGIEDSYKLKKIFLKNNFKYVFHLAAQAGVRYSIMHPEKYVDSNIRGFFNIIDNCKINKVMRLYYASSSSVYGENDNYPIKEEENLNPKNFYGLSKKINEEIAEVYNINYNLKSTGLRFFTVYGEYGRPDMMIMKYLNSFYKKKKFELFNYGNHFRDFTYIKDVCEILFLLLKNNSKLENHEIFNICSNSPINLKKVLNIFSNQLIKPEIKKKPLQLADIKKTHGNNFKVKKITGFKNFTKFEEGLINTINWYKKYYSSK